MDLARGRPRLFLAWVYSQIHDALGSNKERRELREALDWEPDGRRRLTAEERTALENEVGMASIDFAVPLG